MLLFFFQIRANGDERVVCREAFVNLHGITVGRVQHLAFYARTSPTPPTDKRGKHPNPRAMQGDIKKQIHAHIKSFPAMESHYGRAHTAKGRKYLSSYLSVAAMHELYLQKYEPEEFAKLQQGETANPIVKYEYYLEYFNTHFNLSFGTPKTDTCGVCDELTVKIRDAKNVAEKSHFQEEKEIHLRQAQQFYAELRTSTEMAKQNGNIACFSFDFEQNFPLPHIPTGEIFYLRQIWLYVFGIHDCGNNTSAMYCWPESLAHKGSNEVVSCLDNYFRSRSLPAEVDTLYLFSDSCSGQNKNSTVIQYLYSLVRNGHFRCIRHIFPIRGHSFLPSDRDFAKTESKKRKIERIYTPQQWMEVIRSAKKTKPYVVEEVEQSMIYDFQSHLAPCFKKTVTSKKERMRVRDARIFEYSYDHPTQVWVKYSLTDQDEWHKFTIEKKRSTGPTFPTEPAYSQLLPLSSEKVDDVKKVVYKYVPRECRQFYDDIIAASVESDSSPD